MGEKPVKRTPFLWTFALVCCALTGLHANFSETFDGAPATPLPWTQTSWKDRWDVTIHQRNEQDYKALVPHQGHHGPDCSPPIDASGNLVTHLVSGGYENAVYQCKDHVMTSITGFGSHTHDSYALIYLTPNHMVDFSQGEAVIRFSMTTFRTTQRDWIDVWITPFEENLNSPFDQGEVDFQGVPKRAIHINMMPPNNNAKTGFHPSIYKNHVDTGEFRSFSSDFNWFTGYEDFLPSGTSAKDRQIFELRITYRTPGGKSHIKFGMPAFNFYWVDKDIAPLDWSQGVVQFGHHSYTPDKDCSFYAPLPCGPNSWHWDDISISPSLPFTMIKADRRFVDDTATTINFQNPAPANTFLRFAGIGTIDVSFNNGATWQRAQYAPQTTQNTNRWGSFWHPVPPGTQSVKFRGTRATWPWMARDLALWSKEPLGAPAGGLVGDLNGDGIVDVTDLSILLFSWGDTARPPADIDKDGVVDITDLAMLLFNWTP